MGEGRMKTHQQSNLIMYRIKMNKKQVILSMLCVGAILGYTYGLDIPQALQVPLREPPYNFTTIQFNLLYVFLSITIVLFALPMGTILDRFPLQLIIKVIIIVCFLSALLQGFMYWLRPTGYFPIILLSRAVFGVLGDTLFSIQGIVLQRYCPNNYELLLGLVWGLSQFCDSLSSFTTTVIYDASQSVSTPVFVGAGTAGLGCLFGFILIAVMNRQDKKIEKQASLKQSLIEQDQSQQVGNPQEQSEQKQQQQRSILKDIKSLDKTFWITVLAIFVTQSGTLGFIDNLNDLLVKRFGISYIDAGKFAMIPYGVLGILSVFMSKIMSDYPRFRRKGYLISSIGNFVLTAVMALLPNTKNPTPLYYVFIFFFLLWMSFTMTIFYTGIFTCVPFAVEDRVVGTAWGISGTCVGLASCLMPLLYSIVVSISEDDLPNGYQNLTLTAAVIAWLPLILSVYMYFGPLGSLDRKYSEIEEEKKKGRPIHQIINQFNNS